MLELKEYIMKNLKTGNISTIESDMTFSIGDIVYDKYNEPFEVLSSRDKDLPHFSYNKMRGLSM